MKHLFAYASAMDLLFLLVCCGLLTLFCRFRFGAVALPSLAAVLVLIAVTPVWWTSLRLALTPAETDEIGSCWTLGGLRWMVVEQDQERLTLLCLDTVASAPFCQETGDSRWTESSLRTYLNGEFLERFTQEEMALLLPRTHQVILSRLYLEEADSGDDEIYCFPVQTLADRGADRAWSKEVTDLVSLPDVTMLGDLARSGWTIRGDFWLETPYYYSNGDMVRYLSSDGLILFQQSQAQHGVRPVIQIDRDAIS